MKNVIVPFIQDQLLVMKIPPITGTKSKEFSGNFLIFKNLLDTKIGNVDYTLSDIVFSGLNIPPKGVSVDFKEEITIKV